MITVNVTGLKELSKAFSKGSQLVKDEIKIALGQAISMAEGEAKRRTPVDTGLLRSSIGGSGGFKTVEGLRASVGTNLSYAYYVEVRKDLQHPVGEWGFMQKGAKAASPFIVSVLEKAMERIAKGLVK